MATYYAVTTTNPASGWTLLGTAESREAAKEFEPKLNEQSDIYAQTEYRNFAVWSKTQAVKNLGKNGLEALVEAWCEDI